MIKYIEVTDKDEGFRAIFPVFAIRSVIEDTDGNAILEVGETKRGEPISFIAAEKYDYIAAQLMPQIKGD